MFEEDKIKVLQLGKFFPPEIGGIENFIYNLSEELSKYVKVDVLCSNSKFKNQIDDLGKYKVYRSASLGKLFSTAISPHMISLLRRLHKNYDIIHMHLPDPMANLAIFLIQPKTKLVLHWHSDIIRQKRLLKVYEPLLIWLLKRADVIIATSPNYIESSKYLKKFREKCVVIPLGINPDQLKFNREEVKSIRKKFVGKPIVFSLGRLVYYKGFEYLIRAMKNTDAYLLIGGEGPLKERLEKLVKNLNIKNKVFFLGKINSRDLGNFYKACDIFCLPSVERTEAFGLVQIEAMFFGKPIVSTNIKGSGVSWVNKHKITGLVVEPRNPFALASAINFLNKNPYRKKIMGKYAQQIARKYFHIEVVAKNILNIYYELLAK